jgi:hypothetical protein
MLLVTLVRWLSLVCIKSLTCNLFDLSFSSATIAIAAVLATSVVADDVTPGFISPMAIHAAVAAVRSPQQSGRSLSITRRR